jgi:hypothetical protein
MHVGALAILVHDRLFINTLAHTRCVVGVAPACIRFPPTTGKVNKARRTIWSYSDDLGAIQPPLRATVGK